MIASLSLEHIKAVCYGDVFSFPLTDSELDTYKIRDKKYNEKYPTKYSKCISHTDTYFFLSGRDALVAGRKLRARCSVKKLARAKKFAYLISAIPIVEMVAVTGALSMKNAKPDDDIDLLIVAKAGWIWTTRFLVILILDACAARRRPGTTPVKDKICVNMFMDKNHLRIPKNERDLFSAHEVVQITPLWSTNGTAELFYSENKWVSEYLPNAKAKRSVPQECVKDRFIVRFIIVILSYICIIVRLERVLARMQLWYMKKRRTKEVLLDGYLRFHPADARRWVLAGYKKRLRALGIK